MKPRSEFKVNDDSDDMSALSNLSRGDLLELLTVILLWLDISSQIVTCMRAQDLFVCGHARVEKIYVGVSTIFVRNDTI